MVWPDELGTFAAYGAGELYSFWVPDITSSFEVGLEVFLFYVSCIVCPCDIGLDYTVPLAWVISHTQLYYW